MTKRILSVFLVTVLALSALCTAAFGVPAPYVPGDADGDGEVTVLDATCIQRVLASLSVRFYDERAAEVDGDGEVTVLDATCIQRLLAGLIDRLPVMDQIPTEPPTYFSTEECSTFRIMVICDETAFVLADRDEVSGAQSVTLTAHPEEGYRFKEWAIEGGFSLISGSYTAPVIEISPYTDICAKAIVEKIPDEVTKVKNSITVYFSNNKKRSVVNAYIYKQSTGEAMAEWPGRAMTYVKTNDMGEKVYSVTADVTEYDRVIFNNGTDQTTDTPLTKASSGYFLNSKRSSAYNNKFLAGVYPYGQNGEGKAETVTMDYPDGYQKKVYIWMPEGYDAADKSKKYSVLYMCDGQNLFGQTSTLSGYEWECDESVLSLMRNGGDGVIVVGADNSTDRRDHELTPDLGTLNPIAGDSFKNGGGKVYADFMADTVIPYVEAHYNTNSIRGVAGSSSGGIEAFYIGMEHLDKFRYIGALSPAFLLYGKAVWNKYLSEKDFTGELPRIYFYCGNGSSDPLEQALYPDSVAMEGRLKALGYPADKMVTVTDSDATHSEGFWALYFPEMLCWGLDV